ncbi:molybdopterin molybdotransferase MoeA [Exilibacterium tricleocarpae]|uniref:Molybdopterin molybdenumtransferase n=1 Tax=Exilibacterium tricleocarpae TaxID=2591008 RepID=A0A545U5G4_9GAMM|nr:gephyrin-like molybdotransferase Glp [Exilibacterium tricleocarpae]TQV84702.1 molybdopterin molybdotransferase MoeA [Exilibacterium tricleocarpae]
MLTVAQARQKILAALPAPLSETETLPLQECPGRVLAEPQNAGVDVPPADNSAMDGYAVDTASLTAGEETWLPVSQRLPAGIAPQPLQPHTAARIFTGAEIPPNANAVVMQEKCETDGEQVRLPADVAPQQNIRLRGQDIHSGQQILAAGQLLQPQDIGLLASVGIAEVNVLRRLRIAVISTGDELVNPGQPLAPGQIYNSNRFQLSALLQKLNMQTVDLGNIADDPASTRAALIAAAAQADCILTTGGVSVGEEDYVKQAVADLGRLELWRLALKPGKPLAFGDVQGTPVFGLPGNPVSTFVTFMIFVRPYLLQMQGLDYQEPRPEQRRINFAVTKASFRQEYKRVRINDAGTLDAYANQSSGVLSSIAWANAFAVIPPDTTLAPGDEVATLPFASLFL